MRKSNIGCLYIIATPIGNPKDITIRALEILHSVDAVICEEWREGTTLLKAIGVSPKEIILLNEHNEATQLPSIISRLFNNQNLALISDCGTPVFADPGYLLVQQVSQSGISIIPIPGPSSLTAALSILDFKIEKFLFAGFLPRDSQKRKAELQRLRNIHYPIVIMDTPYRLKSLLADAGKIYGNEYPCTLACDLTLPTEIIVRGTISEVRKKVENRKAEFILILHGKNLR